MPLSKALSLCFCSFLNKAGVTISISQDEEIDSGRWRSLPRVMSFGWDLSDLSSPSPGCGTFLFLNTGPCCFYHHLNFKKLLSYFIILKSSSLNILTSKLWMFYRQATVKTRLSIRRYLVVIFGGVTASHNLNKNPQGPFQGEMWNFSSGEEDFDKIFPVSSRRCQHWKRPTRQWLGRKNDETF